MKITINNREYELYIGNSMDSDVDNEGSDLDKFIEAIGDTKGLLFTNYPFSDDHDYYYCGSSPVYNINGYREEPSEYELERWTKEEIEASYEHDDRTLEQVKEELKKNDKMQVVFLKDGWFKDTSSEIFYAAYDDRFSLGNLHGQLGDIFGWSE